MAALSERGCFLHLVPLLAAALRAAASDIRLGFSVSLNGLRAVLLIKSFINATENQL